jgi:hypothetical protein
MRTVDLDERPLFLLTDTPSRTGPSAPSASPASLFHLKRMINDVSPINAVLVPILRRFCRFQ